MPRAGRTTGRPKANTTARGYGTAHQAERKRWSPVVAAGQAWCARCGRWIAPGQPWDLDHAADRTAYLGPSHRRCNRSAGARLGAKITNARRNTNRKPASLPIW